MTEEELNAAALRRSNRELAQKLSRVQEALSRAKIEKDSLEADLSSANTALFDKLTLQEKQLSREADKCKNLQANVATLECIVQDVQEEKHKWASAFSELQRNYAVLQTKLESLDRTTASTLERAGDHAEDALLRRDGHLVDVTRAVQMLDAMRAPLAAVLDQSTQLQDCALVSVERQIRTLQLQFALTTQAEESIIDHLQSQLAQKDAIIERQHQRLTVVEEALTESERVLAKAKAQLLRRDRFIASLERELKERDMPVTPETLQEGRRSWKADGQKGEFASVQVPQIAESTTTAAESVPGPSHLAQSLDIERRLVAYTHRLELALRAQEKETAVLREHMRNEAEARQRASSGARTEMNEGVRQFAGVVQEALSRLTKSVEGARQQSTASTLSAGGLSASPPSVSCSPFSGSPFSSSPSPRPPHAPS